LKLKSFLILFTAIIGLLLFTVLSAFTVSAGDQPSTGVPVATSTSYIQLNNEPGGDIDMSVPAEWDGVYENPNGAMVWNGTEWIINNTWAHTYFTEIKTGQRLISHTLAASFDGSGAPNVTVVQGYCDCYYTVTQAIYSYTVPANTGGYFGYEAVEYRITQPDGKRLIVRSRGCGLGITQAYLDIYLEDPDGVHVSAFRGDPVMYVYSTSLEQSVLITDETQGAVASLPTFAPDERARYWLDVDNGSDMGGYSYVFRTQALDCQTHNLGSSFPGEFQIQFYDPATNIVQEIQFLPRLLSETPPDQPIYLPLIIK
jgi:hypothetical protein